METLNSLIKKTATVSGPETIESAYMDLMESLIRHIAVVSIAAYKNNGFRQKNIDFQITRQLTTPSMGSWKNIIEMLSNAGEKYFTEQFYQKFLFLLEQKITDPTICKAFSRIEQLLEFASTETSHYQFAQTERSCTAKQFFQKMVEYRNRFVGHGTGSRPEYLINSVVVLRDGVIGICSHLKKIWLHYPIYLSRHEHLAGQTYCKMTPLSQSGDAAIETPNPDIKPGMLHICLDKKNQVFETVFPLAIWHDSDIMFLNGTKNFKTILYLGYNRPESVFGTDKFAIPFCEYYLSFMGLSLKPVNLMSRSAWEKIETIINSGGWTPPKLKKGMIFQNKEAKSYRLVNKIHSGKTAEIWKAEVLSDGTTVAVKFLSDKQFFYRFRREALTLQILNETSQDVVKYYDFVFDPHPLSQALFIVMEYLTERPLKNLYQPGRLLMPDDIIMWLEKSLLAVLPFHRQEIVHRNITPDSLVFDKKEGVKLIDTGLSGYTEHKHPALYSDIPCAGEEEAVDAFEYASPEQLQYGKMEDAVTTKSDVFSLGASFYFILTGQPPYGSTNAAAVAKNHTVAGISASSENILKPITEFFPECPPFLNDTILGMLHTDPYLRRDISAVISDINTYQEDQKNHIENKNCLILPRMDDSDVHFKGLMPTWLNFYMFRLWPVMLILVWSFSAFLSINLDVFSSIQPEAFSFIPDNASVFPFLADFVYTTWIIMSFLFVLMLKRIVRSVQPIVKEIYTLDNNKDGEHWVASQNRNNRWSSFIHSKWLLMVVLTAAIFQCYTSIEKVQTSPILNIFYWSDWRISWWAFSSKVFVVFFNAIGILYCLFSMAALIDLFSFILRGINPHLDMYNRDNQSGLMCIGKLLTLFLPVFLIFLYGLTIILVIDFGKSSIHTFEHLAGIVILSFLYFFFILWPIFPVHKLIRVRRKTEQSILQRRRNMIENRQKKYLIMQGDFDLSQADDFLNLSRLHEAILNQESTVQKLNTWPLNRTSFLILSFAGLSPLFFAVTFVSLKNIIF